MKRSIALTLFLAATTTFAAPPAGNCTLKGLSAHEVYFLSKAKSLKALQLKAESKGYQLVSDDEEATYRVVYMCVYGGAGTGRTIKTFLDSPSGIAEFWGSSEAPFLGGYEKVLRKAALDALDQMPNCPATSG